MRCLPIVQDERMPTAAKSRIGSMCVTHPNLTGLSRNENPGVANDISIYAEACAGVLASRCLFIVHYRA